MDNPVILVVEDNEIQRKVIKLLASEFGFEAIVCSNCQEALDAFIVGGDIYSLVLMDLRLPDKEGSVCTKALRSIRLKNRKSIAVIAMTGYMGNDDRRKCIELGFDDLLTKPFSSKEFRDIVLKWAKKPVPRYEHQGNVFQFPDSDRSSQQQKG